MKRNDTEWLQGTVLIELEPGPMPVIPKALWAQVQEWIASWRHAEALREAGQMAPGALLLHGPTGSGKTMLARAILKHMGGRPGCIMEAHNVLTKMFGGSANNVAAVFAAAQMNDALMVIEEIDALGISRRVGASGGDSEENKITITLMRVMESAKFPIIATTNFREALDPALLRRFELQLEVPELDEGGARTRAQEDPRERAERGTCGGAVDSFDPTGAQAATHGVHRRKGGS